MMLAFALTLLTILRVPLQYGTIESAITAAVSGDTVLVAPGTYTPPSSQGFNPFGKNLLLSSSALVPAPGGAVPESALVTVNCAGGRGIQFNSGEGPTSIVRGFRFVNGAAPGAGSGGAIVVNGTSPRFEHCVITGNVAGATGGGVFVRGTGNAPRFTHCTIAANRAGIGGGGIHQDGNSNSVTYTRCIVWGNCAPTGGELSITGTSTAFLTCSDIDSTGVSGTPTYLSGNVFANPLFCIPETCLRAPKAGGVFAPAADSPALPGNNACGSPMGALEAGCTEPTSVWTGEGDGSSWFDAANWAIEVPPASRDVLVGGSTVIENGTAMGRGVRVLGDGGSLALGSGTLICDTLGVDAGAALTLYDPGAVLRAATLVLGAGALFGWGNGAIVIDGGRFEKVGDLYVGDAPDTSTLELRNGATATVSGTLRVGRDLGDRGRVIVGPGAQLDAADVEIGVLGSGMLLVEEPGAVRTGYGGTILDPRTTVGPYGELRGTGTVHGLVQSRGLVSPGAEVADPRRGEGIGSLRIAGSYAQQTEGALQIQCGAARWDSLLVTNQVAFSGTLRLTRQFDLDVLPDSADVVRYGAWGGAFDAVIVQGASPEDSIFAVLHYGPGALRVTLLGTIGQLGTPPELTTPLRLLAGYPNPFRAATTIAFELVERTPARLRIYDVTGRVVRTILHWDQGEPGTYNTVWRGDTDAGIPASSGIYYARLDAGRARQVRALVKLE